MMRDREEHMTDTIEREAKLFEAGSYPDRGIEITEDDLDRIVRGTAYAPVRIEHAPSPFDGAMGVLKSVYRRGRELFGRLAFPRAAWELIRQANARRLSVAIRSDKSAIAEVSLVREPRIADAAVFAGGETVRVGEFELDAEVAQPDGSDAEDLRRELARHKAERLIDDLKRAGKVAPAAAPFALALLDAGDSSVVTFAEEPVSVAEVFRRFIESQPKVIEFRELASGDGAADEPGIFEKLGVTSAQVEKHRSR